MRWPFWLLLLLSSLSKATPLSSEHVWLDPPVSVADGQAIRIDIRTSAVLFHARVTRIFACSAIDQPFRAYVASAAGETGCNSPGFERQQIYSIEEMHAHGSLASKFRVRQTAQSLYIRRRLVEKHSPVVYLEVHLDVQDENTRTMPPPGATAATASVDDEWVLVTRFECPERALPLGVESYGSKNGDGSSSSSSSAWSTIMSAFSPADEDDSDQLVNPSTSVFGSSGYNDKGIHWSVYAIFFGAALCGLTILYLVAFSRRKLLVRNKMRTFRAFGQTTRISVDDDDNDNDYAKSKQAAETSIITRWMAAGSRRGLFTSMARDIDVLSLLESGKSRHDKLP